MNGFIDDPIAVLAVAGIVREYHPWAWDEGDGASYRGYPGNENKWAPSYAGGGGWNFDSYYRSYQASKSAVIPAPVIQGSVRWLTSDSEAQPVARGQSSTEPRSYAAHADHLFQYAARYGKTKVALDKLKLADGQPRASGLGLVSYFENWNEPDKWWKGAPGAPGNFSAEEFAAMTSADYDGHCRALGETVGVRNADPEARMVLGGLAGQDKVNQLPYLSAIKAWADEHRGGSFPADVINVHHYSRNASHGISPEEDQLKSKLEEIVAWRDQNVPGRELWLSEFGYDTNSVTQQGVPSIGTRSEYVVQGAWNIRSYLAAAAAGIDRAFLFMIRDTNYQDKTQFSSSGLVYYGDGSRPPPPGKKNHDPKPSWFFVATMKATLSGMLFDGEVKSGNPEVRVYRFNKLSGGGGAYAVWCATARDLSVKGFALELPGATTASLITLADGEPRGKSSPLVLKGGLASVDVSEVPLFVVVDSVRN
ncbi:MAG TPA: hypothetical protein VGP93_06125 [Polyangiaceae bacterium]|nr:hypothetical protein [Polyangiaceae bacterium]